MAEKEIERRWVIPKNKISKDFFSADDYLRTAFFNSDVGHFRLREKHKSDGTTYKLCIKKGKGLSRFEIETTIYKEEFDILSEGLKFVKTYYKAVCVSGVGSKIYILEYKDMGDDVIMEVEFNSEEEAKEFNLGAVIANDSDYKEVTEDKKYNFHSYYERVINGSK